MARGWESKSVESQQSEVETGTGRRRLTHEEQDRVSRRQSLETQRTRVMRELENARSATHRAALENGLKYLDDELTKFRKS
jgi:hypothetical protein